jgi:CDP-diacylglycerol--glycerol-3-phosphate 3-phosphatidyltransferase
MEKMNSPKIMNLPNGVTVIRILAIPFILILLFATGKPFQIITALVFLFVALTDMLDGYFARRQKMVTTLGKFLDPLADKLLIVTALIALISARGIPLWMVVVIVGREIAVTGLRGIAMSEGMVISSSLIGKYKTAFEMAAIFFLILRGPFLSIDFHLIGMVLLWVALILAILSGVDYFKRFLKVILT